MRLFKFFTAIVAISLLGSCKRDSVQSEAGNTINNDVVSSEQLVVPDGFDYATTQDLMLDVKITDRDGTPLRGVRVDIFDAPNDGISTRKVFATATTDNNGTINVPLSIPTYQKQVTVFPYAMGVPNNVEVPVKGNLVQFHYVQGKMQTLVVYSNTNNTIIEGFERKTGVASKFSFRFGGWNSNGVPNYLTTPDVLSTAFRNRVLAALPEQRAVPIFRPQYLNNVLPVLEVTQTADVWLTFVHEGASLKNVLFFYKYPKNNPPTSVNDIDSLYTVFPNVNFTGSGGGLTAGDRVNIGRFGKDTLIGFAIAANGFNGSSQVTPGLNIWYSHKNFNNEAASFKDHVVMLYDDSTERYIIAFEDVRRDNGQSDQDFNDVVFYASANPPKNISNPQVPPINDPRDCDSDGVPDFYDDYPCDGTKAYDRYFPSKTDFGTVAFEDLWPATGDYDLNDLVVRWRFHAVVNAQNNVLELNCKTFVDAKGAALLGGFGVEFPFNASLVNTVTGSDITRGRATLSPKGTEAGHTRAVMIFFDEAADQLSKPGGSFFNTVRFSPAALPDTINTKMTFTTPLAFASLGTYPFNPFLFTSNRNIEVHLPNRANTVLANTALFGTNKDNSIPSSGRYYRTVGNLPWAIHIPVKFDYPAEKKDVVTAHLRFAAWVQSNGSTNADWYEDKPTYRNNSNLFTR